MKFGLPEDFPLEIEHQKSSRIGNSVQNAKRERDLVTLSCASDEKSKIYSDDWVNKSQRDELSRYMNIREDIKSSFEAFEDYLHEEYAARENKLEASYRKTKESVTSKVKSLTEEIERRLYIQKKEVEDIIKKEEERVRREEEEKRARELQLKKEKEENEARKRREQEEEKRRKEEEIKKEQEIRRKEEEERKKKLEESAKVNKGFTNFSAVEEEFLQRKKDIVDIKENIVKPVNTNKELKKQVGVLKRRLNPKFGQLSNSFAQLNNVASEVVSIINESKNINNEAFKWILNFVAKAIISQAEAEVTVKPTASLPLARLSYILLTQFPEFEYFLNARFVKKCPFIIGYSCSIGTEEGRIRMGWKRSDSKWEEDIKYDERVSGICSLWSVMTRLPEQSKNYYKIDASWRFLARLLNTEKSLLTNAHFHCVSNWWEACAKAFLEFYGTQGQKLLQLASSEWPLSVSDNKLPGAARLLILGEEWNSQNDLHTLKEMEP
ncbi:Piso0_003308 [Millerozyma farinosa CBS 7064]|uniref:mRNA export factor GLE1 n=1 Tax=Pichia sorbitophila (strain ATCC MYA-4447 / BCRC 22081 / CBS 7064 / NBRC 10061 / NRRL Y-12695) TaxID=559304 RepID=G8YHR9_PICSO|nr:Piso0_003308 [Millerozyma farinosa CBS 7064]CCE80971.1 Piso0_003308 [Millerozyma farinosa CBS 7064]